MVRREVMFLIAGYNKNEMNNTALPYILGHTPAGTSTQNMIHYAQVSVLTCLLPTDNLLRRPFPSTELDTGFSTPLHPGPHPGRHLHSEHDSLRPG